jgi:thymidylate synthase
MNNLDKQYQALLQDILDNGIQKGDRTGTGTISVFGRQIRHKMSEGFPLLTSKRIKFDLVVTELLWFLRGDTNIKFLVDNDCHIWDGDAYKNYDNIQSTHHAINQARNMTNMDGAKPLELTKPISKEEFINKIKTDNEFAKKWGELGPIYGKQWRSWSKLEPNTGQSGIDKLSLFNGPHSYYLTHIDQITNLINDLKTNPDSRRLMVNAWNPAEIDQCVLPPCHYGFQVYTRELSPVEIVKQAKKDGLWRDEIPEGITLSELQKDFKTRAISLMWNQRSVDTFLGLPFNIASYGLLLEIIAKEVNMVPDELIGNLGDTHLYLNHSEQAKEQIGRELTDEERYNIWFNNNYETGMERYFDPNKLPDFDNEYYNPTPKRTREPYPLPTLKIVGNEPSIIEKPQYWKNGDFIIENYQSHPAIKAPLSN